MNINIDDLLYTSQDDNILIDYTLNDIEIINTYNLNELIDFTNVSSENENNNNSNNIVWNSKESKIILSPHKEKEKLKKENYNILNISDLKQIDNEKNINNIDINKSELISTNIPNSDSNVNTLSPLRNRANSHRLSIELENSFYNNHDIIQHTLKLYKDKNNTLESQLISSNNILNAWKIRSETLSTDVQLLQNDKQHNDLKYDNDIKALKLKINELKNSLEYIINRDTLTLHKDVISMEPIKGEVLETRLELNNLRSLCVDQFSSFQKEIQELKKFMQSTLTMQSTLLSNASKKYKAEQISRKHWYNMVQELRGNIRILVRFRPLVENEIELANEEAFINDQFTVETSSFNKVNRFEFDRIFGENATQSDIFSEVSPLLLSAMDGYCVSLIAYGATKSGKTYSMVGTNSNPGIIFQSVSELLNIESERKPDYQYTFSASCMEIYNDNIYDLLSITRTKLTKVHTVGGNISVEDLTYVKIASLDDIQYVINCGLNNRSVFATNINDHSSRSHLIICIRISGINVVTNLKLSGKLTLVDLAGSERVSKSEVVGDRLVETQQINKSLSSLGDVIFALQNKDKHIPYRNSKLTFLLSDSLGSNAKTCILFNVCPSVAMKNETMNSLLFAARVSRVELNNLSSKK